MQNLLDNDRDLDKVNEAKVDKACRGSEVTFTFFEKRHEDYCKTIDDADEVIKEDAWLKSCQSTFISMQLIIGNRAK